MNLHATYVSESGLWIGNLAIRNALDDRLAQSATYTGAIGYDLENPPRTVLASVRRLL